MYKNLKFKLQSFQVLNSTTVEVVHVLKFNAKFMSTLRMQRKNHSNYFNKHSLLKIFKPLLCSRLFLSQKIFLSSPSLF